VSQIDHLVRLQETDLKIRAMEKELADIPARKQLEQTRLEEHQKQLAARTDALKHAQADLKKLELDVESFREKIRKLRQQQLELKTNKEFQAVETEVATIERQITGVDDQQLVVMDRIEQLRAEVKERETALAAEDAAVKRDLAAWDLRATELARAVAAEKTVRAELAKAVEPAWLASYTRIFEKKDRALVPVEEGVCGGCHMKLPPYLVHDSRKRAAIVSCGFCGRMLYS
jgi:hypothetical protein